VLAVAGAVVVLAAVGIVLALTLTGNEKAKAPISVTADLVSVNGIQQHGLVLGNPLAKVTLTEYVDTSCPICKDYALNTFPAVSADYVRTGKVKIEGRLVAFVGPSSKRGRELVIAAARQNKAWQMLELLYQNQGDETQSWLTDDLARALAAKIPGLQVDKLMADSSSAEVLTQAVGMDKQMRDDSVSATPTFLLTTPDGRRHLLGAGNAAASTFAQVFDKALATK
jgi:protein-disulfide isomerase